MKGRREGEKVPKYLKTPCGIEAFTKCLPLTKICLRWQSTTLVRLIIHNKGESVG